MTGSRAGKLMPRGNGKFRLIFRKNEGTSDSNHFIRSKAKKGLPAASVMVVMVLHTWFFKGKYTEQKKKGTGRTISGNFHKSVVD